MLTSSGHPEGVIKNITSQYRFLPIRELTKGYQGITNSKIIAFEWPFCYISSLLENTFAK
jgi:hypothetical protein